MKRKYDHKKIEIKYQEKWERESMNSALDMRKVKKPFYNLWMFPYPSAEGLHMGTAFSSTGSDVFGRYMRMKGYDVFQPIGYDSFGIHSENYAIKVGKNPNEIIGKTTKNFEKQFKLLSHAYDWNRTVTTSNINYYKWTQWIFTQLFKAGLSYRKESVVNWCPSCLTVLSDEQVMTPKQAGKEAKRIDGGKVENAAEALVCERCGYVVEKKELKQWHFRITDYADKLLDGLSRIDWPGKIKTAQTNWIGKKDGITITYPIRGVTKGGSDLNRNLDLKRSDPNEISCWTSRPDTNFGATFVVVSPEYAKENLLQQISSDRRKKSEEYIYESLAKSKEDRITEGRKKTGVFTGLYAINQLNDYEMPIWIADFVLSEVGTGAVVGVPGHDKRDFEFASQFELPVKRVVVGPDKDKGEITKVEQVQEEEGVMVSSGFLDGMDIKGAIGKMMDHLEKKGWGKRETNYHLRDWIISRQRYWGPPIPMIYCSSCAKEGKSWFAKNQPSTINHQPLLLHSDQGDWSHAGWYPVDEEDLPVELPYISDYKPKGEGKGPLANHPEFYETKCPGCGGSARRETDVSDTFLDSSWYFLAYPNVDSEEWKGKNKNHSTIQPFNHGITHKWLPVDLYFGGAEHAVLHLMYSRFVTMVLKDLGYVEFPEPFPKFFAHGLMIKDGAKMSKSRGNVVNPDEYIEKFGADTLRLYLMFMGPMDGYPDFRDTGIEGMRRFIEKVWRLFQMSNVKCQMSNVVLSKMHQTIKKVTSDIEEFKYNTAIAAIMEYVNALRAQLPIFNDQFPMDKTKGGIPQKVGSSHLAKSQRNDKCQMSNVKKENNQPANRSTNQQINWLTNYLTTLAQLLAPFAPHMADCLWQEVLGNKKSVHLSTWPKYESKYLKVDQIEVVVQVNGKLRSTIELKTEDSKLKTKVIEKAKENEKIRKWVEGKEIKKTIFVPGKLVNFVV